MRCALESQPCPPCPSLRAPSTKRWRSCCASGSSAASWSPGSWIDEVKLAQEYGISRTPLREALKVLAAEGLVTMKVRRGAYVTEVSDQDLAEVYHLLSLLESDAAAVVATTATDGAAEGTAGCHADLEGAVGDRGPLLRHQRALPHAAARDRRQPLAQPDGGRPAQGDEAEPAQLAAEVGAHRREPGRARIVVQALQKRDAAAAVERMQEHFRNGLEAAA
jgi:DNA-binding GntR family transcriptional regulator